MYEDEPQDRVHDVLAEAVFGEHPLGRRVLGRGRGDRLDPGPGDRRLPRRALHGRRTSSSPRPGTSSTSGSSSWPSACSSPRRAAPNGARRRRRWTARARLRFQQKDTEQYHICFGGPGITRADERRFALAVLDSIFGGSTSSRLFREVREKRGLAYAVGSYTEQYTDAGMVAIYVGTREDNVAEACAIIGAELARLRDEPRLRRGARAGQGARQGPPRARARSRPRRGCRGSPARRSSTCRSSPSTRCSSGWTRSPSRTSTGLARGALRAERPLGRRVGPDEELFRGALAPVSEALVAA